MGLYNMQIYGFMAMILCYVLMAVVLHVNVGTPTLKMIFYGFTFFFTNFGPNTTTFVIPSELFPTAVKASCHGLSAAMGKLGAVLGAQAFPLLLPMIGLHGVMYCCVGVALAGLLCSFVFTPKWVGWKTQKVPSQV
jgi:PHS family inorganic phosphate transporter-like MFS transporter